MSDHDGFFRFRLEEKGLIEAIKSAVHKLLSRDNIAPSEIHAVALTLNALVDLPKVPSEVHINFILRQSGETGSVWIGISIFADRFELDLGESVQSPHGSDNDSRTVFELSPYARAEDNDLSTAFSWVEMFDSFARNPASSILFEDFSRKMTYWNETNDNDYWPDLPEWDEFE